MGRVERVGFGRTNRFALLFSVASLGLKPQFAQAMQNLPVKDCCAEMSPPSDPLPAQLSRPQRLILLRLWAVLHIMGSSERAVN